MGRTSRRRAACGALGFAIATQKSSGGVVGWLIFGALLAGRYFRGWRGRKAVHWTLAGFTMLLLAYVGSKFVLEIILRRG